jgi:hypothetical protein
MQKTHVIVRFGAKTWKTAAHSSSSLMVSALAVLETVLRVALGFQNLTPTGNLCLAHQVGAHEIMFAEAGDARLLAAVSLALTVHTTKQMPRQMGNLRVSQHAAAQHAEVFGHRSTMSSGLLDKILRI